jgi:hypothetical protein
MRTPLSGLGFLLGAAGLLLACLDPGRRSSGAGTVSYEALDAAAAAGQEIVGIAAVLELARHKSFVLHRGGVLSANMVGFDTGGARIFTHTAPLPAIGERRIQLGDLVSFVPSKTHSDVQLSQLEKLRFQPGPETESGERFLSHSFVGGVPERLRIRPAWASVTPPEYRSELAEEEVVAVVAGLAVGEHEEFLDSGKVLLADVIVLDVGQPGGAEQRIVAYDYTLPAIGGRRVQLGDRVSLVPPTPSSETFFPHLQNLRFHD